MSLFLWSTPLWFFSLSLQSRAEVAQGDNFCSELMCVTAFVNSSAITYRMTALNQLGWMAMGFGTQMADAKMVIMWPNSDGSVTLSQRTAPGLVEPVPDPNPPRKATLYNPLTNLSSSALPSLAFTVSKDDTIQQNVIWALGVSNPLSSSPDVNLELHLDSGNFTLNLTNFIDTDDIPSLNPLPIPTSTSSSSSTSLTSPSDAPSDDEPLLETFEKLIIAHAVLSVAGFLVLLPIGALIARWARTLWDNWMYHHWMAQVIFGIPVVVTGWALGPLAVAAQGTTHVNDSHKVLGILLLPLYLIQLSLGTFVHIRRPTYPRRHPPRNITHGLLGMVIVGLAFYQVRTGLTVDWTTATSRPIDLNIFSNIWVAWVVFIPAVYFIGFMLLPRQLAFERELPPPYSPGASEQEGSNGAGVRQLLGLEPGDVDDGTHDIFSESVSRGRGRRISNNEPPEDIEMREVPSERRTPLSLTSSVLALPS